MSAQKCQKCGLINPPEAVTCDCGFNLNKNVQEFPIDRKTYKHPHYSQPGRNPKDSQSGENIRLARGLSCPKCETVTEGKHGYLIWGFVILLFPIGLLLLLTKKTYACYKCGYIFKV